MASLRFLVSIAASLGASWALFSCSLLNAPDDVMGQGGAGTLATGPGSTVTVPPGCAIDPDCASLTTPCKRGVCLPDATCGTENLPAGTACGTDAPSDCRAVDTCDAAGACVPNPAPDGTFCDDCPGGPGTCAACMGGACNACATRATEKTFRAPLATSGWALTGDFGVYDAAAPADGDPAIPFDHPVLGTDGNRKRPYPGHEKEESSATSPPTMLPATLRFASWHVDEGTDFDKKTVSISTDGGNSFEIVAVCPDTAPFPYPFCERIDARAASDWDTVSIDLAALGFAGQIGMVRFSYRSDDACCNFERGWYVDALGFATDCACTTDADCRHLDGPCAQGTCDGTAECTVAPRNAGGTCGDPADTICTAPDICSVHGLCDPNDLARDGVPCETCPEGSGLCLQCVESACQNCPPVQVFDAPGGADGWTLTGDWGLTTCVPVTFTGEASLCFPELDVALGTDGARATPYPGAEVERSSARSPVSVLPQTLTFRSWHVDRGGRSGYDGKRVRVSIDGGRTFTTIVDCQTADQPFCEERTSRGAADWDMIAIDMGNFAGMTGIVELTYDTLDTGASFSRGWYVDDINVARCDYTAF